MNKKCPNASAKNLNIGSKRKGIDGNMWIVAKRTNGKYWKKIIKQKGGVKCGTTVTGYNNRDNPLYACLNHTYGNKLLAESKGCTKTYYEPCTNICDINGRSCTHYRVVTEVSHNFEYAGKNRNGTIFYQCSRCSNKQSE